jgi:hypothetical protein
MSNTNCGSERPCARNSRRLSAAKKETAYTMRRQRLIHTNNVGTRRTACVNLKERDDRELVGRGDRLRITHQSGAGSEGDQPTRISIVTLHTL